MGTAKAAEAVSSKMLESGSIIEERVGMNECGFQQKAEEMRTKRVVGGVGTWTNNGMGTRRKPSEAYIRRALNHVRQAGHTGSHGLHRRAVGRNIPPGFDSNRLRSCILF